MLPPAAEVRGDGDRLAQVLTHLLQNAIRYTPGGGRAQLHLDVEEPDDHGDGEAVLRVEDDGVGMAPDAVERAFEHFLERRPDAETRGLGLAFCKAVVEDHGGRVTLRSEEGEGTTVTVRLPLLVREREQER